MATPKAEGQQRNAEPIPTTLVSPSAVVPASTVTVNEAPRQSTLPPKAPNGNVQVSEVANTRSNTGPHTTQGQHVRVANPTENGHAHPHHHHFTSDVVSAIEHGFGAAAQGIRRVNSSGHLMRQKLWDRFRGKGRKPVTWMTSAKNVATSSYLNLFLIFIPLAWASHFSTNKNFHNNSITFAFSFLSLIPLEKLFEYGGEQMSYYLGKDLGDLVIITLNNAVEATLAIILLFKCELRILQATIIGVVLLHLLLVPGTAFLTGGARIWEQNLHPGPTQLNQSLLTIGVLSLLIPSAFFSAIDRGENTPNLLTDETRHQFLQMSRGLAVILLCIYIASRFFLHNPPGEGNGFRPAPNAPKEIHEHEEHLLKADPEVNPWFCVLFLVITIAIMAATAEWLVKSIAVVRDRGTIKEEWFGLILLPIVSFSGDGVVAVFYFIRAMLRQHPEPPVAIARARNIDLSIQFTLFWMPVFVLLSWWTDKTLSLLFDVYEVALILGGCFLVNYITADNKTNWVEGFIMVSFYIMIALCSWFYPGQEQINVFLHCATVADVLAGVATESR